MIINIPTESDYFKIANNNLNIVWDNLFGLVSEYDHAEIINDGDIQFYLNCSYHRHNKATWLVLIQAASELFIKGKILNMGNQYLIDDIRRNKIKTECEEEVSFSDLKSIDASKLTKKYNELYDERVSSSFDKIFNELRKVRNQIMHSALPDFEYSIYEIIIFILEIQRQFGELWVISRNRYFFFY